MHYLLCTAAFLRLISALNSINQPLFFSNAHKFKIIGYSSAIGKFQIYVCTCGANEDCEIEGGANAFVIGQLREGNFAANQ